jgi:hypothetical protein
VGAAIGHATGECCEAPRRSARTTPARPTATSDRAGSPARRLVDRNWRRLAGSLAGVKADGSLEIGCLALAHRVAGSRRTALARRLAEEVVALRQPPSRSGRIATARRLA